MEDWEAKDFQQFLEKQAEEFYAEREKMLSEMGIDMREFERVVLLSAVDARWMDHIDAMDHLRDGIGLRAYGQKDPVTEYKLESFEMFEEMVRLIREDTVTRLYQARVQKAPERHTVATPTTETGADAGAMQQRTLPEGGKISRNALCPCGSGKKYKHCHGKDEQ
jgi:preprotein translocase subunit SecA